MSVVLSVSESSTEVPSLQRASVTGDKFVYKKVLGVLLATHLSFPFETQRHWPVTRRYGPLFMPKL